MSKSSVSCLAKSHDHERPDLESIRGIVDSINEYMIGFLENVESWNSLKSQCTSMLNTIQNQKFFEFSEHSVLSNLYWGIESIEAAIQAKCPEEKTDHLRNSERLLQVPALLDEHGVTAGIQNQFLVCFSYFYLSAVKKLQNDEWQVALHYLQAMAVSPRLVRTEFAPEFCRVLFPLSNKSEIEDESSWDFGEDNTDEAIRQIARRYKHWLMYCQIMLHGETSGHCRSRNTSSPDKESQDLSHVMKSSSDLWNSVKQGHCLHSYHKYEKVHPLDLQGNRIEGKANEPMSNDIQELQYYSNALKQLDQVPKVNIQNANLDKCKSIRRLQEIVMEGELDSPTSASSCDGYDLEEHNSEENMDDSINSTSTTRRGVHDLQAECWDQMLQAPCSTVHSMSTTKIFPRASQHRMREEASEVNIDDLFSERFLSSVSDLDLRVLELGGKRSDIQWNSHLKKSSQKLVQHRATRTKQDPHSRENLNEFCVHYRRDSSAELIGDIEKVISKLCFSEGLAKFDEDYTGEVMTIYKMLNNKRGVKYTMLKDVMLDQLLTAISTSKEERVIRASVSILTTIISVNKSAVEDIKNKGLRLCDLATALKRNVHEAAILIHMINPSPAEMKTLELLPALVEVVCSSKSYMEKPATPLLTPPAASLMIIEVLVTAFDCATNNTHLAAINSPRVLRELLNVAGNNNLEGYVSLANVIVKCMQFDGQCRESVAQCIPVAPFICLLQSNEKCAKFAALRFFHELLRMPRSPATNLLQQIRKEGGTKIMKVLVYCVRELPTDYQLLAANLLLQLDTVEESSEKGSFKEEAVQVILKSVDSEVSSPTQQLSAFIFANLGGTYAWTGEPYTVAWLVKKAGLTSLCHRNMIRNYDWLDQNLQDGVVDSWSSKIGKHVIDVGKPVFHALEKGLRSKAKRVSRDSLTAIAWIGFEIAKCPTSLRYSACEILLGGIEQFLHPGSELEERLLACLCIYNYASGRGMQKLIHFSEGVRESLRRFSGVTWMADELHRVADYYLPTQSVSIL
ncbi:E3 ubiquitin-protein ligase LIN-1 [Populus alba x Populus x berolinensis]|nr:E3 ubiquitin-protein ligase LIN-1 [Populus alba x Populus x berolinensis]